MLGYDHGKLSDKPSRPIEDQLIDSSSLEKLEQLAVRLIKDWFTSKNLVNVKGLISILYRLSEWDNTIEIKNYIAGFIEDDSNLIQLLEACLNRSTTQGTDDYVSTINWSINLKSISELLDVDLANQRLLAYKDSEKFLSLMKDCNLQ